MATLPLVKGTAQVLYPFTRRVRFQTGIYVSANGSEQRCPGRGVPLFEFVLNYSNLSLSDRNAINTFFTGRPGAFDTTWQMTVLGVTYQHLKFTDDVIRWKESSPNLYSSTINVRQVQNPGYSIPSVGSSFPSLASGAFTQLPYGPEWRDLTSVNDQPSGFAYGYQWYGAGLSGFPSSALRRWGLSNPSLSDADVATIENYFVGNLGAYGAFSVTDPEDSSVHTNCRFETDVLEIQYQQFAQTVVNFSVIETNG